MNIDPYRKTNRQAATNQPISTRRRVNSVSVCSRHHYAKKIERPMTGEAGEKSLVDIAIAHARHKESLQREAGGCDVGSGDRTSDRIPTIAARAPSAETSFDAHADARTPTHANAHLLDNNQKP